ncbi:MAG: ATP-binding protein [Methylocystaceae bacterium]|nr:MAG: ATP-binding protein [Methylocystaceae bacterium]
MRCLSLKAGLSWLIGVVLLATPLIHISILMTHAGPRIRAEDDASLRLTRELVVVAIASLQETEDPRPALRRLYESLGSLRHVDVKVFPDDSSSVLGLTQKSRSGSGGVPDWFVSIVDATPRILIVPVMIRGVSHGRIAIVSDPIDELAEIWSDVSRLGLISLLVTSMILGFVLVAVRYWLAPFDSLRLALAALESGKSGVRVEPRGAAEFRSISSALNSLAATLDRVETENQTLLNELVRVQDDERKEIARDLHDEAGPCLFSIRAGAVALSDILSEKAFDLSRVREICASVNKASDALQTLFRGLLVRLKPRGLSEFGLSAVLNSLVASWRASHPEIALELVCPHDLSSLDEAVALTAYRVVQEATTNVFRHARARWSQIRLEFEPMPRSTKDGPEFEDIPGLHIAIEDDGVGIAVQQSPGLGLLGMRERVQALGGRMSIGARSAGGARIDVWLPLPEEEDNG